MGDDIELLKDVLKRELPFDAVAGLKTKDEVQKILLNAYRDDASIVGSIRVRLRSIQKLWQLTDCNVPLFADITAATQGNSEFETLPGIITRFHGWSKFPDEWPNRQKYEVDVVKRMYAFKVWAEQPTASVRGLLRDGIISFPKVENVDEAATTAVLLKILDECVARDVKVGKDSAVSVLESFRANTTLETANVSRASQRFQDILRLMAVASIPTDITALLAEGFHSAEDIARTDRKVFCDRLSKRIPPDGSQMIWDHALIIETRNEQAWLRLLQKSSQDLELAPLSTTASTNTTAGTPGGQLLSYQAMFNDADSSSCEHCNSVLSPCAYFVDLLRMMQEVEIVKARQGETLKSKTTLLDRFLERRGDLAALKLSCANTNELIAYVDLVHEILQSRSATLASGSTSASEMSKFHPSKSPAEYHSDALASDGDCFFDLDLHQKVISKLTYPGPNLPFSLGHAMTTAFSIAMNSSLTDIRSTFSSTYRIFDTTKFPGISSTRLLSHAKIVVDRSSAAAVLGLSQEDFILITREAFHSPSTVELEQGALSSGVFNQISKDYATLVSFPEIHTQWGYASALDMFNKDETKQSSLSFIQSGFLPRSGLSFSELLQLLKTQFLTRRFIITSAMPNGDFSGRLEHLRLRLIPNPNEEDRLPGFSLLFVVLSFIRLLRKLQWTIPELDQALSGLRRMDARSPLSEYIEPHHLIHLSWIKRLKDFSGLEISELMPLWTNIDTNGSQSLYHTLFRQQKSARNVKLFEPDESGTFFWHHAELQDGFPVISAALDITMTDTLELISICSFKPSDDLSLPNLSKIYRYHALGRLLKVELSHLRLLGGQPDTAFFASPESTYASLSSWSLLAANNITTRDILSFLTPSVALPQAESLEVLRQLATVYADAQNIVTMIASAVRKRYPDDPAVANQSKDSLLSVVIGLADDVFSLLVGAFDPEPVENCHRAFVLFEGAASLEAPKQYWTSTTLDKERLWSATGSLDVKQARGTNLVQFKADRPLLLESVTDDISKISIKQDGKEVESIGKYLVPVASVERLLKVVEKIARSVRMLHAFDLSSQEAEAICNEEILGRPVNIYEPGPSDLLVINDYVRLRHLIKKRTRNERLLLDFLHWIANPSDPNLFEERLALLVGVPRDVMRTIIAEKYPGVSVPDILALFKNPIELSGILDIVNFLANTKFGPSNLRLLFRIADPPSIVHPGKEYTNAADLRTEVKKRYANAPKGEESLYSAAVAKLVDKCRAALIQYLLQTDFCKSQSLFDADALFEYFLIDVNMGPGLKTSRVKQAISTVQLFIQRCILGMEVKNTIFPAMIKRERWEWCRSYQLWEAARKIFLYPENYADPTLRDDKSEIFKALEAKIMQSNLGDPDTMSQLVKTYIYEVNDLSDVEIQSYLYENQSSSSKTFHLFARTRNAPYIYYYRTMEFRLSSGSAQTLRYWSPWEKIEVEIPTFETDAKGMALDKVGSYILPTIRNGRLYLFIPHIILKTMPSVQNSGATVNNAQNKNLTQNMSDKYWEVKMGWTERRDGKWSAKRISQACLNVRPLDLTCMNAEKTKDIDKWRPWTSAAMDKNRLPAIDSFKFWIRSAEADGKTKNFASGVGRLLQIDMECWYPNDPLKDLNVDSGKLDAYVYALGRFQMRDYDFIATPAKEVDSTWQLVPKAEGEKQLTLPTKFLKLHWTYTMNTAKTGTRPTNTVFHGNHQDMPVLPRTTDDQYSKSAKERKNIWTMTFDDTQVSKPVGLVVELITVEQGSQNWLRLPLQTIENAEESGDLVNLNNTMSPYLMEQCSRFDLDTLYKNVSSQDLSSNLEAYGPSTAAGYHEQATPYAIYNWEFGFHAVSLMMERLLSTQQLELALNVAKYVFDPTIGEGDAVQCWQFAPFRHLKPKEDTTPSRAVVGLSEKEIKALDAAVVDWQLHPFAAHTVARSFPTSYMRRIVRKYIEILVAMGDRYFRQGTLESMPLAIQRYIEASHLFGARPKVFESLGKAAPSSFQDLTRKQQLNSFSNCIVDMELEFPFWKEPKLRSGLDKSPSLDKMNKGLCGVLRSGYFCVPPNPELVALRDLIDDRLYKTRNCQDINGRAVKLRLFEPPLDPMALVRAVAGGMSPTAFMEAQTGPMPRHRFRYMLQKALDVCAELRNMGDQIISIKEKKDAEAFNAFKSNQDDVISAMVLEQKKQARDEASKTLESLQETRKSHETRLSYYLQLVGEADKVPGVEQEWQDIRQDIEKPTMDELRMSSNEKIEFDLYNEADTLNTNASAIELIAGGLKGLPGMEENIDPMGCGVSIHFDAGNVADFMLISASVMRFSAEVKSSQAAKASRKAQLIRQLQDRRMQANLAGRDIAVIDKQIAAQRIQVKTTESDIKLQEKLIEQSSDMDAWVKSKYTNQQLWNYMDNSISKIYGATYDMAMTLAGSVRKALEFECAGQIADPKILQGNGYWGDHSRDGLFSAQNMWLDLKRMEAAYDAKAFHDFEITKSISLRQVNPIALLELRATGAASFKIPEILFDFDFPGQYMRRIKSVALSIPCIVGPYTGVNCTLALTDSDIRVKPMNGSGEAQTAKYNTTTKGIAISHGQADTGTFELQFTGDTYGPFEGAGVASSWNIELPSPIPQFDYTTISDVIMHMRYTSKDAEDQSRKFATASVKEYVSKKKDYVSQIMLDVKNEYPNEWREVNKALKAGAVDNVTLKLLDLSLRFPFWTKGRGIRAGQVTVVAEMAEGKLPEIALAGAEFKSPVEGKAVENVKLPEMKKMAIAYTGKSREWVKLGVENTKNPFPVKYEGWKLLFRSQEKVSMERLFVVVEYVVDGIFERKTE